MLHLPGKAQRERRGGLNGSRMSRPRPLTDTERRTIVRLYRDGLALDEIGREVRRGHLLVRQVIRKAGVKIRPKGGRKSQAERRAIIKRSKLWNNVDRAQGRPPRGYNCEAELLERERAEAVEAATSLPSWLLSLPASARPIDPYPVG